MPAIHHKSFIFAPFTQKLYATLLLPSVAKTRCSDWTWGTNCTSRSKPWDQCFGHDFPTCARALCDSCCFRFVFHTFNLLQLFMSGTYTPHSPLFYLSLPGVHADWSAHFPGRCESVYSFSRGQLHTWWQPRMVVLAQVRECGEVEVNGPTGCPSGPAQPAHSCSFSSGASTGMSAHVRDHCLKVGFPKWLKRPIRRINKDESQICCVSFL